MNFRQRVRIWWHDSLSEDLLLTLSEPRAAPLASQLTTALPGPVAAGLAAGLAAQLASRLAASKPLAFRGGS